MIRQGRYGGGRWCPSVPPCEKNDSAISDPTAQSLPPIIITRVDASTVSNCKGYAGGGGGDKKDCY